jgi:predicted permease
MLLTRVVTPGYHETLGIPLIRGRLLKSTDQNSVARAALVSQELVDKYYPNTDPIGQQIRVGFSWSFGFEEPWRIVGVVGDVRSRRVSREPQPEIYLSQAQLGATSMNVMVRLESGVSIVLPAIREEVQTIDPNVPLRNVEMVNETVDRQYGPARFYLLLLGIFAGVSVTLAGIGLYGVVSFLVTGRTREIGIRMALGARGGDIVRMVFMDGIKPAGCGIALGIAGALLGGRVLGSLLYNVEPSDLATMAGVTTLLICILVLAIVQPARKASRSPLVDALRTE